MKYVILPLYWVARFIAALFHFTLSRLMYLIVVLFITLWHFKFDKKKAIEMYKDWFDGVFFMYVEIGNFRKYSYDTFMDFVNDKKQKLKLGYAIIKPNKKALKENKTKSGLIHHSDRGIQYCSKEYTSILKKKGAIISMTENGSPYENAMAERVNGILKSELLQNKYENTEQAVKAIDKAVKIYNNKRPHLSIGMLTPQQAHKTKGTLKMMWKKKTYSKPFKEAMPCSLNGAAIASLNCKH